MGVVEPSPRLEQRIDDDVDRERERGDVPGRLREARHDDLLDPVQRLERIGSAPDSQRFELGNHFLR